MYIGSICDGVQPEFYYAASFVKVKPTKTDDGYVFPISEIFDSAIDIVYEFNRCHYVGAIEPTIKGHTEMTIYLDRTKISPRSNSIIPIGQNGHRLTIRVRSEKSDIVFGGANLFGCYIKDGEPIIFPQPQVVRFFDTRISIRAAYGEGDDAAFAARFLADSLNERYGSFEKEQGVTVCFKIDQKYESERYTVEANSDGITVTASSRIALLWGACRILDVYDGKTMPALYIDDMPDTPMRGFHMGLPRKDRIEFTKRFFRYVLLPLGYNHVIVEFCGGMRFDRHPEIADAWLEADRAWRNGERERIPHGDMGADGTVLEKEEVRAILSTLEELGIEVIPEVQSLSHVQYITNAYPQISEISLYNETGATDKSIFRPEDIYHCYCPSREDSMRYIYDIIDEIVEVSRPKRYVHIGHDEVYHIGLCPECSKKGGPRVYLEHVNALYTYLKKMGLGTMIWSDVLHTEMYYFNEDFSSVKHLLPKDIILLDFTWYYDVDKDIEDELLSCDYQIMVGNLYSSHYPRSKSRMLKNGMIGGEVSTWIAVSEEEFAAKGKFFDLAYTAEMLWNCSRYEEGNRVAFSSIIGKHILPKMRDLIRARYDLYLVSKNTEAKTVGKFCGNCSRIPPELACYDLAEPTGKIALNDRFDRLIFEHSSLCRMPRIAWAPLLEVGRYVVTYKDGSIIDVPVRYGGEVISRDRFYGAPMPQHYYRHQGYVGTWYADPVFEGITASGEPILILAQPWDNPNPEKVIKEISYIPSDSEYAILVSRGIKGIRKYR